MLIVSLTLQGRCEVNCGSGYFYDSINKLCVPCSLGCESCLDSLTCYSCVTGTYFYQDKCVTACPIGFVASTIDNTCKQCPTNCIRCSISSTSQYIQCTNCITPLYLVDGACYTTCPSITFLSAN